MYVEKLKDTCHFLLMQLDRPSISNFVTMAYSTAVKCSLLASCSSPSARA